MGGCFCIPKFQFAIPAPSVILILIGNPVKIPDSKVRITFPRSVHAGRRGGQIGYDYNSQFPSLSLKFPIPRLLMESGNFNVMERLELQFPVSEFEPQIPDSTTFVGIWEFQRHGISRGLGLQFRNSRISIPSPPLHSHLTSSQVKSSQVLCFCLTLSVDSHLHWHC